MAESLFRDSTSQIYRDTYERFKFPHTEEEYTQMMQDIQDKNDAVRCLLNLNHTLFILPRTEVENVL